MGKDRFERFGLRNSRLKQRLRNPYFSRRGTSSPSPASRRGRRKAILALAGTATVAAVIGAPFAAWTHPAFRVGEPEYRIEGVAQDRVGAIRAAVDAALAQGFLFGLDRRSYFLVDTGRIARAAGETGVYASVRVTKDFPRRLRVMVRGVEQALILTAWNQQAIADGRGVVVELLNASDATSSAAELLLAGSSLTAVSVHRDASSTARWVIGTQGICEHCATLIGVMERGTRAAGLVPTRYEVAGDESQVRIRFKDGFDVLTDPIAGPQDQLERLVSVLKDDRYRDRSRIEYVDVRYADRVYVKQR